MFFSSPLVVSREGRIPTLLYVRPYVLVSFFCGCAPPGRRSRQRDAGLFRKVQSRSVPPDDAGATGTEIGMLIGLSQTTHVVWPLSQNPIADSAVKAVQVPELLYRHDSLLSGQCKHAYVHSKTGLNRAQYSQKHRDRGRE